MNLIIKQEEKILVELNTNITTMKEQMVNSVDTQEYKDLLQQMDNNIKKLEDDVTALKRSKFSRDLIDYEKNQVYTWKFTPGRGRNPRSILKQRAQRNRRLARTVSFTDTEASMDMTNVVTPEEMSDSSNDSAREDIVYESEARNRNLSSASYNTSWQQRGRGQQGSKNDQRGRGRGKGRGEPVLRPYTLRNKRK